MEKLNLSRFEDAVILAELDYFYHRESAEYIELLCQTKDKEFFVYSSRLLLEYSGLEWSDDTFIHMSIPEVKELLLKRNMTDLYESLFGKVE